MVIARVTVVDNVIYVGSNMKTQLYESVQHSEALNNTNESKTQTTVSRNRQYLPLTQTDINKC